MEIPDLIGIKLEDISDQIKGLRDFYTVLIKETVSPFKRNEQDKSECRVVRKQIFDNTIIITVSYF